MLVKCPSCDTEYDCEPGKYRCSCGAEFTVPADNDSVTSSPRRASADFIDDPDVTIAPRQMHAQPESGTSDVTMPGRRDRKPDGRFEVGDMVLGRYKVLSKLGQGGMGAVYECFDEVAGIKIALKALPPELARSELEMEDVKENFQLVSKLVHQNIAICKPLEKDNATGNYYLIMERVEGEDLRRWIKRMRREGSLTLENVLPVIRQVASALDYAHAERIIHRDIKPGNIMIDAEGKVKVLDFGLAAQIHTSMTRVSMVSQGTGGTAPYMAPEQWNGKAQGAAADQYALAVMTYEMLAGHLPFESSDVAVLREAVLNAQPRPVEGLPEYAQAAIGRALSKEPSGRFETCSVFADTLSGKVVEPAAPNAEVSNSPAGPERVRSVSFGNGEAARLVKRISILTDQQDWNYAHTYCIKALDEDPENPELYLLMCMIILRVRNEDALKHCAQDLLQDKNFQTALKFASPERRKQLESIRQDALVSFHLKKCMDANHVQKRTNLSHCSIPLGTDENFQTALKTASPERKKELLQIQYNQADYFLDQLKKRYHVLELAQVPVPLDEDRFFQMALLCASPKHRKELQLIQYDQAEFFLKQLKAKLGVKDLSRATVQLGSEQLFQMALFCASPERKKELEDYPRKQCEYFLEQCMETNHVSNKTELARIETPLAEDNNFKMALLCALPEYREELHTLQYEQVESFLEKCMDTNHVSSEAELSSCPSPLNEDKYFRLAIQYASPERREQLERILSAQAFGFLLKCMETHHVSDASQLADIRMPLDEDPYFRQTLACANLEQKTQFEQIVSQQRQIMKRRKERGSIFRLCGIVLLLFLVAVLWNNRMTIRATLGDAETKYRLAKRFETGDGVKQDHFKAAEWYRKAAGQGHFEAADALQRYGMIIPLSDQTCIMMAKVDAGSFVMSAEDGENAPGENAHRATLQQVFYIGWTEVTQSQWIAVMKSNYSSFEGKDLPVEQVSWYNAMVFCEELNRMGKAPSGWKFTLPTEAQWEYAARGGRKSKGYKYSGSNDIDKVAWYDNNSSGRTHPVGQKAPNELGLYDMSGNVWEWCLDDWLDESTALIEEFSRGTEPGGPMQRASRGGSWYNDKKDCRSASRNPGGFSHRSDTCGFRVALVPESY